MDAVRRAGIGPNGPPQTATACGRQSDRTVRPAGDRSLEHQVIHPAHEPPGPPRRRAPRPVRRRPRPAPHPGRHPGRRILVAHDPQPHDRGDRHRRAARGDPRDRTAGRLVVGPVEGPRARVPRAASGTGRRWDRRQRRSCSRSGATSSARSARRNALDVEPSLVNRYVLANQLRIVHHEIDILGRGGGESTLPAIGAYCANEQGKYWDYSHWVYANQQGENQGGFKRDRLVQIAVAAGLDEAKFTTCLDSQPAADAFAAVQAQGQAARDQPDPDDVPERDALRRPQEPPPTGRR